MKSANQYFQEKLHKSVLVSSGTLKIPKPPVSPGNTLDYNKLKQEHQQNQSKGTHIPQSSLNYRTLRSEFNRMKRNSLNKADGQPVTHVAGIPIPHELRHHFDLGEVVPQEHPLREAAANFVTQVWRKSQPEGARMSVKLLGIGADGQMAKPPQIKPGYATMKSERLNLRSLLKTRT